MAVDPPPARRARYGVLLLALIATYLVSAFTQTRWGGAIHVGFVAVVALLAPRHTRPWRPAGWLAVGTGAATGAAAGLGAASADKTGNGLANVWAALVLLLTVVIIVDRVVRMDDGAEHLRGAERLPADRADVRRLVRRDR
jgi:peptidoglycan/LPS O-acetylase OafA/YrhL